MFRKILKWLGFALLALVALIAIYAAMHARAVGNMARVSGASITEVSRYTPAETVKGCPSTPLLTAAPDALPAKSFAAMKDWSDKRGGASLIVLIDGKIAGEAYSSGITQATRTQSNSMHKSVVALMIGAAIEAGIIGSVDDPVGKYLDELKGDPRGQITLRQLLSMSSGLHNPSMAKMEGPAMEMMLGNVSDAALGLPIETKPGIFNYNNANLQLAGTALSRALKRAGKGRYADFLSQQMWCPLGNGDALLWLEYEGGEPRYFAFLNAAARDWARVGELLRRKGEWNGKQLIPAAWMAEVVKPSAANPNYGLGIWRGSPWAAQRRYSKEVSLTVPQAEAFLADDVYYFDGFGGQRVYVVPSAKLVIARAGTPGKDWDEAALVNIALRGLKP